MKLRKLLINFTVDLVFGMAMLPVIVVFHAADQMAEGLCWLHNKLWRD